MRIASAFHLLAFALSCVTLVACGGGGSSSPEPPDSPEPTADFGAVLVSKVARTGVAGTWGYVAPDGSRYALMGTAAGVLVLDLRDPANPRVVDEVAGPTNTGAPGIYWREMRVYGQHAYVVSEHTNFRGGIMILDLSGLPDSVRFVRSVTPQDGRLPAHTLDIDVARGLLYLQREGNGAAPHGGGRDATALHHGAGSEKPAHPVGDADHGSIEIWDLSADPENPRYVATFNRNRSVHDMTAVGDRVYVAEGNASSFSVWDVSEVAAPSLIVRWSVEAGRFTHNIWPSGDGSFVVTTEEYPVGLPARVWQLDGSAPPLLLSEFKIGSGTPHNVVMEGRMAYLSHYTEGAVAVDLGDPADPQVVARLDTNPYEGAALAGCWGVYKFPGEPLMVCSDIDHGFHLIELAP
ncbi:LVIVD repeat-containing protein [Piscinibacter sp.]|uniref:LVIVD repeat-containing protein n=1 Tax=Piscinibacter sp. TaxID=1903157 RepID=UPI002C045E42|nr:choice-of-anchor B family protein [Albitalea sp.]HUG21364.1 choice-of-anchor B family protein [Albitalea sp.]